MPNYFNPYVNAYPASYNPNMYGSTMYQQAVPSVSQQVQTQPQCAMGWVSDGEIEARGRQIPPGVSQYYMFDTNQPVIYLKSINPMGMPNPMQILDYTVRNQNTPLPASEQSEASAPKADMSQYVTKEDFNRLRNELRSMLGKSGSENNQNGSNGRQNRGGNA